MATILALVASVLVPCVGTAGCSSRRAERIAAARPGVLESELVAEMSSTLPGKRARMSARYYEGYWLETLRGDMAGARKAYDEVVAEAGIVAPEIAARAALRLAALELVFGRERQAFELTARAWVLGRDHTDIVEQADRLQARLGSLRAGESEVRGPPIGTPLEGASTRVAGEFARAEELSSAYHRIRLEPRLEQLRAGVRSKENAMENAVRAYRAVQASGEPIAQVAAEFRAASLYHDLALSLMFELPPELEPRERARLQRTLRTSALAYLRRARTGYQRSLGLAGGSPSPANERWVIAADAGVRSVGDLLGDRE